MQTVLTQLHVSKGLKKWGKRGEDAIKKELQQVVDVDILSPQKKSDLSQDDIDRALEYLMFLKEKRNKEIKARGCVDGRPQQNYLSKEEVSSSTVILESVFMIAVIGAKEERHHITLDIPGAFLQTGVEDGDRIILRLAGRMVHQLLSIKPEWKEFVVYEKGIAVIYATLNQYMYGTMEAAKKFWKKLSKALLDDGFVFNPYDDCVMNKIVNGKQLTVCWHVDDLLCSHVDKAVLKQFVKWLSKEFGKHAPLVVNEGKLHDYLGMMMDFHKKGKVVINMKSYIKTMLEELPPEFDGKEKTPASKHLFEVNEDPKLLNEKRKQFFHTYVAKLLYLCKRARPDVATAVAFLCTRVQHPDEDDWKKLIKVMKYLRGTNHLVLTLEADDTGLLYWHIDGAFGVHPDMRGHTGGNFSLGKGTISGASLKHKLNTRSSTEAEVVSVDQMISQVIWTRLFLEAQGYEVRNNILYQDNKSAQLLETNVNEHGI